MVILHFTVVFFHKYDLRDSKINISLQGLFIAYSHAADEGAGRLGFLVWQSILDLPHPSKSINYKQGFNFLITFL